MTGWHGSPPLVRLWSVSYEEVCDFGLAAVHQHPDDGRESFLVALGLKMDRELVLDTVANSVGEERVRLIPLVRVSRHDLNLQILADPFPVAVECFLKLRKRDLGAAGLRDVNVRAFIVARDDEIAEGSPKLRVGRWQRPLGGFGNVIG